MPKNCHWLTAAAIFVSGIVSWAASDASDTEFQHDREKYRKLSEEAMAILDDADQLELISIDPNLEPTKATKSFRGWSVLGQTRVDDKPTRARLIASLYKGISESQGVAGCFEPRHGIRAVKGSKSVDLVICLACAWMEVHVGNSETAVWTSGSPQVTFDAILTQAKVPLAPKPKDDEK